MTVRTEHIGIAIGMSYSDRDGKTCEACGAYKPYAEYRKRGKGQFAHLERGRCKQCEKEKRPSYDTIMRRNGYRPI